MATRPEFSELLAELAAGGLLIVDPFPDAVGQGEEQIAFRTLVQLDGDVCLSIHAGVVARSDFAELFAAHSRHVREVLEYKGARLRRLANIFSRFGLVLGALGGGGAGMQTGDITLLVLHIPATVMPYAAASLGAAVFWMLADAGLRLLLRRWAFGRVALPKQPSNS